MTMTPTQLADFNNLIASFDQPTLHEANKIVIARIRGTVYAAVKSYNYGDRVSFVGRGGAPVYGMVIKTNQKSVSVSADSGGVWRVSPSLLTLAPIYANIAMYE